ncbi:MAG: PilZ domain-containing protein [Chloroflexota bacterium]
MNIQEQIINDLKDVANSSGEVDFMNVYKGLPIVNKAYIQAIHNNVVTFTIHKQQAACLKHDNSPLILSNSLRDAASGDVTALDTSVLTATMTNFEYAGHRIRGRMVLRVVPNDPIEVKIITGDQTFTFNMADICVEGIGVDGSPAAWHPKRNNSIEIEFYLPTGRIRSTGTVRYATQELNPSRIGFDFAHGTHVRAQVNEYITQRREEILRELEEG